MDVTTILSMLNVPIGAGLTVLLCFIKIPKLEINIWGLIGRAMSSKINEPVMTQLNSLDNKVDGLESKIGEVETKCNNLEVKLDEHIVTSKQDRVQAARNRILRFNDEILAGQEHTKEHYDDLLIVIDEYEKYCEEHPEFPNNRCLMAVENIKEEYKERLKNNSFVKIERLVQAKKQ